MRLPEGYESQYLAQTVGGALQQALAEVCVMRPRDPIEFLAQCLYRHAEKVERDRQELEARELEEQETIQHLLESQHLATISHEDDVLKSERERRKRIYLDREREVEILNSPRSSRSRKSSMSSDLGASANFGASIGLRMPPASSSNPNELAVPGPVPPAIDPTDDQVTDDVEGATQQVGETHNIEITAAKPEKDQEGAGEEQGVDKKETDEGDVLVGQEQKVEGQREVNVLSADPQVEAPTGGEAADDAAPPAAESDPANTAPSVPLEEAADKEERQPPPQDNENDNTKVDQRADANETPGETEVIGDSSHPEVEPTTEKAADVPDVTPAADGEANKELYTIGEQEED